MKKVILIKVLIPGLSILVLACGKNDLGGLLHEFASEQRVSTNDVAIDTLFNSESECILELSVDKSGTIFNTLIVQDKKTGKYDPLFVANHNGSGVEVLDPNFIRERWLRKVSDADFAKLYFRLVWSSEYRNGIKYALKESGGFFYLLSDEGDSLSLGLVGKRWKLDTIAHHAKIFD